MAELVDRLQACCDGQRDWLVEHHNEVFDDQKHLDDGSAERAYWHYGYMVALCHVVYAMRSGELDDLAADGQALEAEFDLPDCPLSPSANGDSNG